MMKQHNSAISRIGNAAGFTLIELMIVVVIVAILSAIAYPNYRAYVERGQRSEGRALLVEVSNRLERFYSDCNRYPGNLTDATGVNNNCTGGTGSTGLLVVARLTSGNGYYSVANPTLGANQQSYTLTASPANWTDGDCGNLTLTNTGTRGRSVTTGKSIAECWGK